MQFRLKTIYALFVYRKHNRPGKNSACLQSERVTVNSAEAYSSVERPERIAYPLVIGKLSLKLVAFENRV